MPGRPTLVVYVDDGRRVCISQGDDARAPDGIVRLDLDQVPVVCKWLMECLAEAGDGREQ